MQHPAVTDEMKAAFHARNNELGLSPDDVVDEINTGDYKSALVLSLNSNDKASQGVRALIVNTVDDAKRLTGVPDSDYDNGLIEHHHESLAQFSADKDCVSAQDLSPEQNAIIRKAVVAYVYGDSKKVVSYRDIINSHYFPMSFTASATKNLLVKAGKSVTLPAGCHNFLTITIEDGGDLILEGEVCVTCQKMLAP